MKSSANLLDEALSQWNGEMSPPPRLRSAITAADLVEELPLQEYDRAFRADLDDIRTADPADASSLLKRYIGWTIQTLTEWDPHDDRRGLHLFAALVASDVWNRTDGFWPLLVGRIKEATPLSGGLEAVVKMAEPTAVFGEGVPIWEKEHLDALRKADSEASWEELSKLAAAFRNSPPGDPVINQSVIGLSLLDRARLVSVVDAKQTWLEARPIVQALPLYASLGIAIDSKSIHAKFAAVSLMTGTSDRTLAPDEIEAASALLLQLSALNDWPEWLAFFNRFPVRNPMLQIPLGRALARASSRALADYVESIELVGAGAEGRLNVAQCLGTFRETASESSRRILFKSAFERWANWDFGAEKKVGLYSVQRSELDYAVLSWLGEFCDVGFLDEEMLCIDDRLRKIEREWFTSFSELQTAAKRLFSRYRLFAIAKTNRASAAELAADGDLTSWLPAMDEYFIAKYLSDH